MSAENNFLSFKMFILPPGVAAPLAPTTTPNTLLIVFNRTKSSSYFINRQV